MAGSVTVSVLAPNGRRQTVRLGASTLLMQVLEEVCKKQNFSADDYDLKFQRSILDLSTQGRFANLPNNAKLEMVPSTRQRSSVDAQVRIALQAADGTRMQQSFMTGATLWDVVMAFPQSRSVVEQQCEGSPPACVYTHDEYVGDEVLKTTMLKSLGITGGSAVIRFLVKRELTSSRESGPSDGAGPSALPGDPSNPGDPRDLQPEPRGGGSPRPGTSSQKNTDDDGDDEHRKGTPVPEAVAPSFVPFGGGGQRLGHCEGGGGDGGAAAAAAAHHRAAPPTSAPAQARAGTGPTQAKKYRVDRGEEGAAGQVQPAAPAQAIQDYSSEQLARPCERQVLVFNPAMELSHAGGVTTGEELPDEFFEVTVDDVRRRLEQLKRERIKLEEASLTTQALRESQELEKMKRYPQVVIRVQFPDRNILQGVFRPNEPVCALVELVKLCLEDPELPFYLYTAPPKRVLDNPTQTLFKANLFPTSLVHFGCTVKRDHYLKPAIVEATEPQIRADAILCSVLPKSPVPSAAPATATVCPVPDSGETSDDPDAEPTAGPSHEASRPTAPVPKWLKLPGKR